MCFRLSVRIETVELKIDHKLNGDANGTATTVSLQMFE